MNHVRAFQLTAGLDETATVYTEAPTTGAFTVVANAALPCRLGRFAQVLPSAGLTYDRSELANELALLWGPDYDLPERAQVEVEGQRWNPIVGTFRAVTMIGGGLGYHFCGVDRAQT